MKMFLLRTKDCHCPECGMAILVIMSAEDEASARRMASTSNSHGPMTGVDWLDMNATLCEEIPRDRPKGIVAGSYFYDPKPPN